MTETGVLPSWQATVLVVEDDPDLCRIFVDALSFSGFQVQPAADGLEALRMIENDRPDGPDEPPSERNETGKHQDLVVGRLTAPG